MHDTMMSLLLILAILVLGLYFALILVFNKSRVSLYATPLTKTAAARRTSLIVLYPGVFRPTRTCGTPPACHMRQSYATLWLWLC